jgi:transcriptional regulator with XRE-family HTH domain
MVEQAVKKAREGFGLSMRELARRSDVSAAQISRIEAGEVERPSVDTLISIAHALDRNPRPLLIASSHIAGDEARDLLRHYFRDRAGAEYDPAVDSELVEEWLHGWHDKLEDARRLLDDPETSDGDLRRLAVEVFLTAETAETLWSDSWIEELGERTGDEELRQLVVLWQGLPARRRAKVLEYLADQAELGRRERLVRRSEEPEAK